MLVKLDHFPKDRGENKKHLKPPRRFMKQKKLRNPSDTGILVHQQQVPIHRLLPLNLPTTGNVLNLPHLLSEGIYQLRPPKTYKTPHSKHSWKNGSTSGRYIYIYIENLDSLIFLRANKNPTARSIPKHLPPPSYSHSWSTTSKG